MIAELRAHSDVAERWWETHNVVQKLHGLKRYLHPTVGPPTLRYEALPLADDGDQLLKARRQITSKEYAWAQRAVRPP